MTGPMEAIRRWVRAEILSAREKAVRDFATFLATTASPKGILQREKLQSFATEFLGSLDQEGEG